jgi:aryl-alcohol dehydrogenase-like predicted oxidoreductase
MLALCEAQDLGALIRSPLGMELLTGKFNADTTFPEDDIRRGWNLKEGRMAGILDALEGIRDVLTSGGRTLAQGALAWIWAQSERAVPIPGFKTVAQVTENAKAMEFGPLSEQQVQEIEWLLETREDDD